MFKNNLLVLLWLGCMACDSGNSSTEGAAPVLETDTVAAQEAKPSALPQTLTDTLMLEGMPEPVSVKLYQSPENWSLPFHTYIPDNFTAESSRTAAQERVDFSMGEARLSFVVLPAGTGRSKAQSQANASLGKANIQSCRSSYAWQWECLYIAGKGVPVGRVLLGEQKGRQFYFLIQYPAEYGDGFGPRYTRVLERFVFK